MPENQQGKIKITPPHYPIVYVRGYAMTASEREDVFHDAYYGFGVTSVEKRQAPPPVYFEADLFEGLLIRFMKEHGYQDSSNPGLLRKAPDPSRSIWVSRFYDVDVFKEQARSIEEHAQDLCDLICERIPQRLADYGVDLSNYKVILLAHSMGGLVCRAFIQKLLPQILKGGKNPSLLGKLAGPKDVVHRFVTMGTPHRGIDLGAVPDFIEDRLVTAFNPLGAGIFKEDRMRAYLDLPKGPDLNKSYDIHSLGPEDRFPVKRCLCLIGSDWSSYGVVRRVTGGFSDGLVKQDRAYIVCGPLSAKTPPETQVGELEYDDAHSAFWANVHRAHSGYRGIVNSYESYENIQRFLFGDTLIRLDLEEIDIRTDREEGLAYFYDIEFKLSIRGTVTYLHRRQQDPCENAIRLQPNEAGSLPKRLFLHHGFMDSTLRPPEEPYSRFLLDFQVAEHRVRQGFVFDHEYPARVIYRETLEARVSKIVEYVWLSDVAGKNPDWQTAAFEGEAFRIPLRPANSFGAVLTARYRRWPDPELTQD